MHHGPYLLIVEDDPDIRESFQDLLEQEGHAVRAARDGQEAIDLLLAAQRLPSLVILDLMMPRKNGWEVLEWLRGSSLFAGIPVVVVSAVVDSAPVGALAWLRKPVEPLTLLEIVSTVLETVEEAGGVPDAVG